MAEDLKLSVVIEAILESKGFEDAKASLTALASQANAAAPIVEKTGTAARRMGDSFGGTRGPVADLTRVLLMNVGVTGAAGEAAKAAGTAMYFMEGAASALAVATTGVVAAVAFLLPNIIKWLSNTKEQNAEQKDLLDTMRSQIPLLERYAKSAKDINEATQTMIQAARGQELRKQAEEIANIEKEVARLEPLLREAHEAGMKGQALTDEWGRQATRLVTLKARLEELKKAQSDNLTLEEKYEKALDAGTPKVTKRAREVEKLTDAQKMNVEQEIDAIIDISTITNKASKDKAKADAIETERILAYMAILERQRQTEAEVAEQKRINSLAAISYAGQALSALSALFGRNKALAIAGAIADTYAGAALALRTIPPPAGWAAAAATIAQGLAAVKNIQEAKVGFDDPFADLTARRLGRQSAMDFVANFGSEFIPGVRAGMSGMGGISYHTTINRGTTIGSVTMPGFMGAGKTEFFKHFNRELNKVGARTERRTTLGR